MVKSIFYKKALLIIKLYYLIINKEKYDGEKFCFKKLVASHDKTDPSELTMCFEGYK